MKKYFTLLLFLSFAMLSFGQSNYQDVVYLKNGSIIRGIIIEQIPNKSIKIETADRNVFVCQIDDIERFTKEQLRDKNGNPLNNIGLQPGLQPGYKGIVELGHQIGVGDYRQNRFKFNFIFGHQINPYISMGVGTGLHYYSGADAVLIPFFLDFRTNFINRKVSPYLSLGIGYSFSYNVANRYIGEGILLTPTFGVSFKISDKSAMFFGFGYEMQRMNNTVSYWGGYREDTENFGAISIKFGISF
ncbi:MAG: hypothetical protein PHP31_01685 [Lentimicrobiaceae bacterium]|nr:hypothetical protein [Lentimicrobiaceae bacterium]